MLSSNIRIPVNSASGKYDVDIGYGLFKDLAVTLKAKNLKSSRFLILTEFCVKNALSSSLSILKSSLEHTFKVEVDLIEIKSGEKSKSRESKNYVEDFMLQNQFDKNSVIIAVGGGVIGDLSGFIASTYYRGINVVQLPTTLLSMVDSSVGGKTAINTPYGKNLIGAFKQPFHVCADLDFLSSLDDRNISNGMAEVIKIATTNDAALFRYLENNAGRKDYRFDQDFLKTVIARAVELKAQVVEQDEKDSGVRNVLNFGHTIGHGIEMSPGNKLLHGECVSIGCVLELMAIRALHMCDDALPLRVEQLLAGYGLPTHLPNTFYQTETALQLMAMDKKNQNGKKRIVLVLEVGKFDEQKLMISVSDELLSRLISPVVRIVPKPSKQENQSIEETRLHASLPGSKSCANRALLLAALGGGDVELCGVPAAEDIRVMLSALTTLGVPLEERDNGMVYMGRCNVLESRSSSLSNDNISNIWVENAGTVARFILVALALICSHSKKSFLIDGNHRMRVRPIGDLVEAIKVALPSVRFEEKGLCGCLPLLLSCGDDNEGERDIDISSSASPFEIEVQNKSSSQFVSALLLAAPLLTSKSGRPVNVNLAHATSFDAEGRPIAVSQPYIDMTLAMLADWGVHVKKTEKGFLIESNAVFMNPAKYVIEADASAATYPLAIAALTGQECKVQVRRDTSARKALQGDSNFANVLAKLGCTVFDDEIDSFVVVKGPANGHVNFSSDISSENPLILPFGDLTDAFLSISPILAVAATNGFESGRFQENDLVASLTDIANQRVKECNRIEAVRKNLSRLGFKVEEHATGLNFFAGPCPTPDAGVSVVQETNNDHRLAMSAAVLSVRLPQIVIPDPRCVEKTFSTFWDMCERDLDISFISERNLREVYHASDEANKIDGLLLQKKSMLSPTQAIFSQHRNLSKKLVFIVGMRNSGKTTVGKALTSRLNDLNFGSRKWKFVDLDEHLNLHSYGCSSINEFVDKNGWSAFRTLETQRLMDLTSQFSAPEFESGSVFSLGGGTLTTLDALNFVHALSRSANIRVIWVRRHDPDVLALNRISFRGKPALTGDIDEVFASRIPQYSKVATMEFCTPPLFSVLNKNESTTAPDDETCLHLFASILRLSFSESCVRHVVMNTDGPSRFVDMDSLNPILPLSTFCSLTLPQYTLEHSEGILRRIASDVSCLELRLDLLDANLNPLLRKFNELASNPSAHFNDLLESAKAFMIAPIFYCRLACSQSRWVSRDLLVTYRTASEGGQGSNSPLATLAVAAAACTLGVDLVDVEAQCLQSAGEDSLRCFAAALPLRPHTRAVLSYHNWAPGVPASSEIVDKYDSMRELVEDLSFPLPVALIKCVYMAVNPQNCTANVANAVYQVESKYLNIEPIKGVYLKPDFSSAYHWCSSVPKFLCLAMGSAGRLTRVCAIHFCPVTHEALLSGAAAPGQMTPSQLDKARELIGFPRRATFVTGKPIQKSASPTLHASGYSHTGYETMFGKFETDEPAVLALNAVYTPQFGGACVTIPLKEQVHFLADEVEEKTDIIKAVNTLYVSKNEKQKKIIRATNTDFLGLKRGIQNLYKGENSDRVGLVVGAGGAARAAVLALLEAKCINQVFIWNRTQERANEMAFSFSEISQVLNKTVSVWSGNDLSELSSKVGVIIGCIPGHSDISSIPQLTQVLSSDKNCVLIEMAYLPEETNIVKEFRRLNGNDADCRIALGIDVLLWQGYEQVSIFTSNLKESFVRLDENAEKDIKDKTLQFYSFVKAQSYI